MSTLNAQDRKLFQILESQSYAVDYYQREYRWQTKHIQALLEDLTERFLREYTPGSSLSAVKQYGTYFLGSLVISEYEGVQYIIDGQQRLTSLTLFLIYLHHQQQVHGIGGPKLDTMIFSDNFGQLDLNLNVPERRAVLEALYRGTPFPLEGALESVKALVERYDDIVSSFPLEDFLERECLPHFLYWLREQVVMVEIRTTSDEEAYAIFETMNDRGLSLTPLEMLKSYLLSNVRGPVQRADAAKAWRERIERLIVFGKDTDTEFVKAWLRAQYAEKIRERKKGSVAEDFDLIGSAFHQWVKANDKRLGLESSQGFETFLKDFHFYAKWFERILNASNALEPGLESIYYNARNEFTQQAMVLLAPLVAGDDDKTVLTKLRLTADYLDSHIIRRFVNGKTI